MLEPTESHAILYIICGVIGATVIGIASYYIARAMKGSLKIVVSRKNVRSGEPIAGRVTVKAKKAIDVDRLYIRLVGERQVRKRNHSGDGTSTSWLEFYRDEADVMMDEHLQAGFSGTYEFSMNAPTVPQLQDHIHAVTDKITDNIDNDFAKSLVKGVGQLAETGSRLNSGRKRWRVISRLETKGVDLGASQKIHVSLKSVV